MFGIQEPKAIELVRYRWPAVKHVGDVVKLEKENLPERIDLVVGGFPCQDLSGMNKTRRGYRFPTVDQPFERFSSQL